VLFTDMVGSTEQAIRLGDRAWRELLRRHQRTVRTELRRFGGHEVDSAGDGFFATFPQPADAVRCALAIRTAVRPLGLAVRSAVHTGEVEPIGSKVGGVAVHLAARAVSAAEPDEILVTSTVRDLVAGSELTFADAGTRTFKGFHEAWHVFRVTGPETVAQEARAPEQEGQSSLPRRAVIFGGLLGAAIVVGVLVLLGLGGRSSATAGPNTVVALGLRDAPTDAVAVARGPLAVLVVEGAVWVASEAGTVTRVAPDGQTQVIGGVGIPTALAAAAGVVWVSEGYGNRVWRIDAASVQLRDGVDAHGRRMWASPDALWLTDDIADRVIRLAPATLEEDGAVALEAGSRPRALVGDGTSVWVANEGAATVIEVDASSAAIVGQPIGLGSTPSDLALGGESLWVTSMDADRLYRIDPDQGRVVDTFDTCDGPDAVVASGDGVWVACRGAGTVRRLAADGAFVADIPMLAIPAALALGDDGIVWVALRAD
jgi:streptogramin lyase